MQEWFEQWFDSPYYHILYKKRNDDEATAFVQQIVQHFQLNEKDTLLDLACGKGRHAKAFAAFGIDVTGLDLSANSIEFASQYENDHLHFYVHDMRQTFRTNYYDMVCNLFTSFGYFNTQHDNVLAARSMFQSVKKDGHVLIDFVNRTHAIQQIDLKRTESLSIEGVQFDIKRSYTDTRFLKQILIQDKGQSLNFEESLNSFTFDQMKDIFISVGFTLVESFGNYMLEPYQSNESSRMILIFKK